MLSKPLMLGLLAVLLGTPAVRAQTAPPQNATAPQRRECRRSGNDSGPQEHGRHLQTLKRFQAKTAVSGERVLMDGQKLQHSASATVDVVRPNKVRARMVSARSERELIFDGKTVRCTRRHRSSIRRSSSTTPSTA